MGQCCSSSETVFSSTSTNPWGSTKQLQAWRSRGVKYHQDVSQSLSQSQEIQNSCQQHSHARNIQKVQFEQSERMFPKFHQWPKTFLWHWSVGRSHFCGKNQKLERLQLNVKPWILYILAAVLIARVLFAAANLHLIWFWGEEFVYLSKG